jgi:hypothetical protein
MYTMILYDVILCYNLVQLYPGMKPCTYIPYIPIWYTDVTLTRTQKGAWTEIREKGSAKLAMSGKEQTPQRDKSELFGFAVGQNGGSGTRAWRSKRHITASQ